MFYELLVMFIEQMNLLALTYREGLDLYFAECRLSPFHLPKNLLSHRSVFPIGVIIPVLNKTRHTGL